jgi:hypothetical protein
MGNLAQRTCADAGEEGQRRECQSSKGPNNQRIYALKQICLQMLPAVICVHMYTYRREQHLLGPRGLGAGSSNTVLRRTGQAIVFTNFVLKPTRQGSSERGYGAHI